MKDSILKLLGERYFLKNETTWEQLAKRVSSIYPPIEDHIVNLEFIPSSPTLFNLNTNGERKGTLSSCFIIDVEDSMESIMETAKEAALITKASGGVGLDVSSLRGSTETVKSIGNRFSSGPLPFINIYNSILDGVQQGGARRGAGMAMMDIDFPDILKFISAKKEKGKFERFNFSIRVNDAFYYALENHPNDTWYVKERTTKKSIPLLDDAGKEVTAQQLWDLIIDNAWQHAEPGIFNSDIAFRRCTVTNVIPKVGANPCQEYVNIPYSSCNLGSNNLSKFVVNGKFDWNRYESAVRKSTRYLDNIIDNNEFPLQKIKDVTLSIRPIGLGYMGLAHALYKMNIPYNSKSGIEFIGKLNRFLVHTAMDESVEIAKEKGSYPAYDEKLFLKANERFFDKNDYDLVDTSKLKSKIKKHGIRNSCLSSIAPTGSISFIADTSSGIEPVFALSYARKIEKLNKQYEYVYISDPVFEEYLNKNYDADTKLKILKHISENNGSCQSCDLMPKKDRDIFVVAGDISPIDHLEALSVAANNCSLSISKTINMPSNATREEVSRVYIDAYKKGVIGVTVYRDGCREGILVHGNSTIENRPDLFSHHHAPKRPKSLPCEIYHVSYKGEKWISFIGLFENKPYEIFCGKYTEDFEMPKDIKNGVLKKIGSGHYDFYSEDSTFHLSNINKIFQNEDNDDFARSVSLSLRSGIHIKYIVDTLNKAKGDITKFSKVLARILKHYIEEGATSSLKCDQCGEKLIYTDGCVKCSNPTCGFSKCG